MAPPTARPDGPLNISLAGLSSIAEPPSLPTSKSPFGGAKTSSALAGLSSTTIGAGSPLHEQASRLFPKRTRELQSQTGLAPNIWGPPTSGTSTPLFEIPESPSQDGFPDLVPLTETGINSPARRGRAGTLPSRISPVGTVNGVNVLTSKTSRPTPSTSPFRPGSSTSAAETAFYSTSPSQTSPATSALLSRLRAGSMPQRASLLGNSVPFGQNGFSSGWGTRSRAATLTSISSAEDPASPQPSGYSKDGMSDSGVRTLDYLGLDEPPQQSRPDALGQAARKSAHQQEPALPDVLGFGMRNSSRFRSFSVNTQSKYQNEPQEGNTSFPLLQSGTLTPSAAAALEAEYEMVQEKVRLHNQAVQAFAVNANAARPRARTAGLVETPQRTSLRNFVQQPVDSIDMGFDLHESDGNDQTTLADSLQHLTMGGNLAMSFDVVDDPEVQVSRSLWIGSIPNSTTMSSLDAIFSRYGAIESTRVLTHKNCGFVNFESVGDAVRARQLLNGKEIFPGAGPVRIGFAKAPNASVSMTPIQNATPPPGTNGNSEAGPPHARDTTGSPHGSSQAQNTLNLPAADRLRELQPDILQIVLDFGGQQTDLAAISANLENAIHYSQLEKEIPLIPEPSATRTYDAPRLRDIRKRIDNGACGLQEVEQIAIDMLPEIAELSSDYLGNTVVQKLFEYCSEQTKEQMLSCIAPHLAEIGVHKNGTWAAQKIIEVCKTENQMQLIVESLHPYIVPLFLDQYGNYVLQGCLRFGSPYNDFIFESMLSQLWEIAQGRFGARAMRACFEAHHATKNQQRLMAAVIAIHSVQLAQNANGALLLTWLLDTCTFPRRRSVLAPRLIPHLVQLCTHKVAYLTVLKVINQRNEPEARDMVLKALFFSPTDAVLEQILYDQTSGVTLIFKILTTPFLDDNMRPDVVQNVSKVLTKIKAQPNQGYKRIMDEVGLSSRPNQPPTQQYASHAHAHPSNDRGRSMIQQQQMPGHVLPQQTFPQRQYSGSYIPSVISNTFDNGISPIRTGSADSFGFAPYNMNGFQAQQQYPQLPYQQMTPQSQYQSYPSTAPQRGTSGYMTNGYNGYGTPPSAVDPFRPMANPSSSPLSFSAQMSPVTGSGGFPNQNFIQNVPSTMYNYSQQYYVSSPMQPVYSGGRGRRG